MGHLWCPLSTRDRMSVTRIHPTRTNLGTPAPITQSCVTCTLHAAIPERCGTVVSCNPKNTLLSDGFLVLTSPVQTHMCGALHDAHCGCFLILTSGVDITSDGWRENCDGKKSSCVGIKLNKHIHFRVARTLKICGRYNLP